MIDMTYAANNRIQILPKLQRALLIVLIFSFVLSLVLYLVFYPGTRKLFLFESLDRPGVCAESRFIPCTHPYAQVRRFTEDLGPSTTDATFAADLALPIESLNLQSRSYNALRRRGILTVGELVAHSEADLLDIRNFGTKSIEEIKEEFESFLDFFDGGDGEHAPEGPVLTKTTDRKSVV